MKTIILTSVVCILLFTSNTTAQTTTIVSTKSDFMDKGIDLYNAHHYKDAIVEFNKAIKNDAKDGKAYYYRGMAKMHDGQKGYCKDLEESLDLGYSTTSDIYYYGCDTHSHK